MGTRFTIQTTERTVDANLRFWFRIFKRHKDRKNPRLVQESSRNSVSGTINTLKHFEVEEAGRIHGPDF
jgi:hypothetical protein